MRYKIVYAASYDRLHSVTIIADNINDAINKFNDSAQLFTTILFSELKAYSKGMYADIVGNRMHAVIEEASPYFNFDTALSITKIFSTKVRGNTVHSGTLVATAKNMLERIP